jgi:hypothetical protein
VDGGLFGEKDSLATVYAAKHLHLAELMNQPDSAVKKIGLYSRWLRQSAPERLTVVVLKRRDENRISMY